jgi:hypothetical protein
MDGRCRTGMTHSITFRQTVLRSLVASAAALTLVVSQAGGASAGGWAVGSLDEAPDASAGTTEEIGFTILQHGVTPVDLTEGDVGIDIFGPGGRQYFPAVSDGTVGHYVATVTFPEELGASYTWQIRMGWFEPQQLGVLELKAPTATVTTTPKADPNVWSTLRWVLLAATLALLVMAIADLLRTRRRRERQSVQTA